MTTLHPTTKNTAGKQQPRHRSLDEEDTEDWRDRHFSHPDEFESNIFDQQEEGGTSSSAGGGGSDGDGSDIDTTPTGSPTSSPVQQSAEDETDGTDTTSNDGGKDDTANNEKDEPDDLAATTAPSNVSNLPDNDGNNPFLPPCQVNDNGEFFINTQAAQDFAENGGMNNIPQSTTIVSFLYQVQGPLTLTVDLLQSTVLPILERQLSANLVPELFAPQACRQITTSASVQITEFFVSEGRSSSQQQPKDSSPGIRRHRRDLENSSSYGSSLADAVPSGQASVTGLQPTPKDTLLPSYEGVRCRTQLVDQASRCFVLTGAFTLSGSQYAPWAVSMAQRATEHIMNSQRALDDSHPLVSHVLYLEAIESVAGDNNQMTSSPNGDATTPSPVDIVSRDGISAGWAWTVGISAIAVCIAAVWWVRRRLRPPRGSYNDENQGCCRRGVRQALITSRGYLAYPSPDPSPRRSVWQQDGDDSVSAMPGNGSDGPWTYPQIPNNEEAVPYFDPVHSSNLDNDRQEESNQFLPDGSFPYTVGNALSNDDGSFAAPFQDDDDDIPAAPSSSWLRDLV